ncbi:MAG: HAMP domain-containing protein [Rubrivivax sp.]|nr:MAG: HAMP domain-containing protein [Rubrivivax sp.]
MSDHAHSTPPIDPAPPWWQRLVPRTLFARVTLILVVGLVTAQLLAFASMQLERGQALRTLMLSSIERDIASSVAILDRLPAAERPAWFDRLERRNYRFSLGGWEDGPPPSSPIVQQLIQAITGALKPFAVTRVAQSPLNPEALLIEVRLSDGSHVVIHGQRVPMPVSNWVPGVLLLQLAVLGLCGWQAVRLVTRPLAQLATVAEELGPDLKATELTETGPTEVARAARAFNAMQRRIAAYMDERVEILAAISHDLQTPMTRMRLRTELMDEGPVRDKLRQDLDAMQALVKQGLAYARTLHGDTESPQKMDLDALLNALVADYQDTGQPVTLAGQLGVPVVTRPHALRRILGNLIDNALKFGGDAAVQLAANEHALTIAVLDRGPGIPADQLEAVTQPFYRVESSRNRDTGGTGLGLAIAQQLAVAIGARLSLHHREGGGLEARLTLPRP